MGQHRWMTYNARCRVTEAARSSAMLEEEAILLDDLRWRNLALCTARQGHSETPRNTARREPSRPPSERPSAMREIRAQPTRQANDRARRSKTPHVRRRRHSAPSPWQGRVSHESQLTPTFQQSGLAGGTVSLWVSWQRHHSSPPLASGAPCANSARRLHGPRHSSIHMTDHKL
jgi:hypothetical protein